MNDNDDMPESGVNSLATRRRALMLGAVTASAIVSVRPALAQSAASILKCDIPVPGPESIGMRIDPYGNLVPRNTPGSFGANGRRFKGEEVKAAMLGRNLPNTRYEQSQAYVNYIRRLQSGQSGFTCYASLQMAR